EDRVTVREGLRGAGVVVARQRPRAGRGDVGRDVQLLGSGVGDVGRRRLVGGAEGDHAVEVLRAGEQAGVRERGDGRPQGADGDEWPGRGAAALDLEAGLVVGVVGEAEVDGPGAVGRRGQPAGGRGGRAGRGIPSRYLAGAQRAVVDLDVVKVAAQ